jgi:hypothetical protein
MVALLDTNMFLCDEKSKGSLFIIKYKQHAVAYIGS